ncbi:hypothetical protein [Buttiauxella sp.]|uniref:hypothetical protein n=1 Tax=Buttiauxella sp. TaxID=1972222 RepID=UPI003C759425
MKEFYTSVVELRQPIKNQFVTEPYECGWAHEAILFLTLAPDTNSFDEIIAQPQISPDGINWTPLAENTININKTGLHAIRLTNFGGWLRAELTISGQARTAMLTLHMTLKG